MTTPSDAFAGMRLNNVSFEIRGTPLLRSVTLELAPSGVTGIIGQNGSGKSTLLKILARQLSATSGEITFGDRPLRAWPNREFARTVAYLPQHTPTAAGLKVRELVALGRYPWHGALGAFRETDKLKVEEALALTGLAAHGDRFVDTLSGGERQRAWLAMLVAQDARLLLLDEPIAALDVAHQVEMLRLLRRLSREKGVASAVVIHEINMAAWFCDRLVALKAGQLIAHAPPSELMQPEPLFRIYDIAMAVMTNSEAAGPIAYVRQPTEST
jgi:iron-chelate-transporting ATPase